MCSSARIGPGQAERDFLQVGVSSIQGPVGASQAGEFGRKHHTTASSVISKKTTAIPPKTSTAPLRLSARKAQSSLSTKVNARPSGQEEDEKRDDGAPGVVCVHRPSQIVCPPPADVNGPAAFGKLRFKASVRPAERPRRGGAGAIMLIGSAPLLGDYPGPRSPFSPGLP